MTDLVIRGGQVIDGSGAPRRRADVAVRDGRVVAVGEIGTGSGARAIDARGRVISPGFVDIHSHSDESVLINSAMESAVHQGVTCVVAGNCGGASAPV
ncbi:MAG: N-acyl-D-amino-acid deacylase, partial [Chloroflexota bacterium]|nr:N-acyl-D-amino-acid deacylase [Chloroflexota bacterium]